MLPMYYGVSPKPDNSFINFLKSKSALQLKLQFLFMFLSMSIISFKFSLPNKKSKENIIYQIPDSIYNGEKRPNLFMRIRK